MKAPIIPAIAKANPVVNLPRLGISISEDFTDSLESRLVFFSICLNKSNLSSSDFWASILSSLVTIGAIGRDKAVLLMLLDKVFEYEVDDVVLE